MVFSLLVAFVVSPWLTFRLFRKFAEAHLRARSTSPPGAEAPGRGPPRPPLPEALHAAPDARGPPLGAPRRRRGSPPPLLRPLRRPRASRSRCSRTTTRASCRSSSTCPRGRRWRRRPRPRASSRSSCRTRPEVADVEVYAGTSAPFNFNGLVRHYFLRSGPLVADLQVNLAPKDDRSQGQPHDRQGDPEPDPPAAKRLGANVKVTEVPPGPPVLSTMVAEIYGPDPVRRIALAKQVRGIFESTPGVVDTDWLVEDASPKVELVVDREKAMRSGVTPEVVVKTLRIALERDGRGPSPRGRRPRERASRPEARPRPALRPRGPPRDDRPVHDGQARPDPRARDRRERRRASRSSTTRTCSP